MPPITGNALFSCKTLEMLENIINISQELGIPGAKAKKTL
jgi:hypothetical protein